MHGYQAPSTLKRSAKPPYGLPSMIAGNRYISEADKFADETEQLYQDGQAFWSKEEFVILCNRLFPTWGTEKWGNSASQYAARLDAGASNPQRREKVYRVLFDRDSYTYVRCTVQDGINFHSLGTELERAGINALAKERSNLQKAHYQLEPEEQHKAEAQFVKNGLDLKAVAHYAASGQTLTETLHQLDDGNGESKQIKNKK
jgi:hypothetical protein